MYSTLEDDSLLLEQIAETTPHIVWMFSADWDELLFVNDAYEDIWGRPVDALIADPRDFLNGIHPDDRDTVRERMQLLAEGNTVELEFRVNPAEDYERWVWVRGEPVYEDGDQTRVTGFTRDITRRKRHEQELERTNRQLEDFAEVLSHDIRNPLQIAMGHIASVRTEHDIEQLDTVAEALDRIETITEDVLELAQTGTIDETEPIDVAGLARRCWNSIDTKQADLVTETQKTIRADRDSLFRLFENLFVNAVEHGGPDVTVTVGATDEGVYIEDDGPGIPADERGRVFESGWSGGEESTGLGLMIVKTIVDAHGWEIAVTTGSEGGARFEIVDSIFE